MSMIKDRNDYMEMEKNSSTSFLHGKYVKPIHFEWL